MAEIIKRGDEYFVCFYGNGLLFEKYAGKDKSHAQKILKEIKDSLPQGAMSNVVPDVEIDIFLDQYLTAAKKNHTAVTCQRFKGVAEDFKQFMTQKFSPGTKLSKVTTNVIEQYRDGLRQEGREAQEINFRLFLLGNILEHAIKKMYLNDNPMLHVRPLACPPPELMVEKELN